MTIGCKETRGAKKESKFPGDIDGNREKSIRIEGKKVEEQNKLVVVCNVYWNSKFKIKSLLSMGGGHSTTSTYA